MEIAKLRFWLSLVVDYQTEINSSDDLQNVPALPNLDFKLRTGDSLMSVVKKSSSTNSKSGYNLDLMFRHNQIDAFFEDPIRKLSEMKSKYFQFEELKKQKVIPEQIRIRKCSIPIYEVKEIYQALNLKQTLFYCKKSVVLEK